MSGEALKNERERLGLTVHDISRLTGMSPRQINAIEQDDFVELCGNPLTLGRYLKIYAKKLEMEAIKRSHY